MVSARDFPYSFWTVAAVRPAGASGLVPTAPIFDQICMLSAVLFACCMVCHGELVRLKPERASLTRYYLLLSAGGAAGGIFVAVIAPHIFRGYTEYQIGLIVCALLIAAVLYRDRRYGGGMGPSRPSQELSFCSASCWCHTSSAGQSRFRPWCGPWIASSTIHF